MADCFFFYRIPEGHALLCLLPAGSFTVSRKVRAFVSSSGGGAHAS